MLVISRKKNESVVIGHDVTITVIEIRGDKVRLGVVAPVQVPVHRQEVYEAIHRRDQYQPSMAAPLPAQIKIVDIDLGQLRRDLGASEAEGDRPVGFTTEGGIRNNGD
jgi:carbon storage regulator